MRQIRAALVQRNAEHEREFYMLLTESEAEDLAANYVPKIVRAKARTMLEWERIQRSRAARPVRARRS